MLKINLPTKELEAEVRQIVEAKKAAQKSPVTMSASTQVLTAAMHMGREMKLRQLVQERAAQQAKAARGKPAVSREQAKAAKRIARMK